MPKYENFQPALLTTISVANHIPKFASAPKPWAVLTNFYLTTTTILIIRCSMNFSLISLTPSPRIFSTILSMTLPLMITIISTPKYLLSTPVIRPISLEFLKMMFVQFQIHRTSMRHNN